MSLTSASRISLSSYPVACRKLFGKDATKTDFWCSQSPPPLTPHYTWSITADIGDTFEEDVEWIFWIVLSALHTPRASLICKTCEACFKAYVQLDLVQSDFWFRYCHHCSWEPAEYSWITLLITYSQYYLTVTFCIISHVWPACLKNIDLVYWILCSYLNLSSLH